MGLCPLGDYYTGKEIIKMSVDAENSGFSEIWVPEHFCSGDAISVLGALSKMTGKVRLATGTVGVSTRHPVLTAMPAANLQTLSKGRMTLGLGLTVLNWLERLGYDYSKPLTLIKESFTIIKGMLEGKTVDFEGRYFKVQRGWKMSKTRFLPSSAALGLVSDLESLRFIQGAAFGGAIFFDGDFIEPVAMLVSTLATRKVFRQAERDEARCQSCDQA